MGIDYLLSRSSRVHASLGRLHRSPEHPGHPVVGDAPVLKFASPPVTGAVMGATSQRSVMGAIDVSDQLDPYPMPVLQMGIGCFTWESAVLAPFLRRAFSSSYV
jgi:hypothetical protein